MWTILVTGGLGFIGSNFIRLLLSKFQNINIVNLDIMSYAGNPENLKDIESLPNYEFVKGDIADLKLVSHLFEKYKFNRVINFASETHVDRSIHNPLEFVNSNVLGTQVLLSAAKNAWNNNYEDKIYLQVSTDEVYGSLGPSGKFTENSQIQPNSPYSASKAGADHLCRAYFKTYGFPSCISRCSNNYGPYQYPEKLIPLMTLNAIEEKSLPVYGDGKNVRDWIHVLDHCEALICILESGTPGEIYNIGSDNEYQNILIVKTIIEHLGKTETLIKYVTDRLGHDRRYAIDSSKIINELNWKAKIDFEEGIRETIDWYQSNKSWWQKIRK